MTRRALLCGVSALAVACILPAPSVQVPISAHDEALQWVAHKIRTCLAKQSLENRRFFCQMVRETDLAKFEAEWLDENHIVAALERQLRFGFGELAKEAELGGLAYSPPVYEDGALTHYGQYVCMALPISVYDCGNREFFDRLDLIAPRYLA